MFLYEHQLRKSKKHEFLGVLTNYITFVIDLNQVIHKLLISYDNLIYKNIAKTSSK